MAFTLYAWSELYINKTVFREKLIDQETNQTWHILLDYWGKRMMSDRSFPLWGECHCCFINELSWLSVHINSKDSKHPRHILGVFLRQQTRNSRLGGIYYQESTWTFNNLSQNRFVFSNARTNIHKWLKDEYNETCEHVVVLCVLHGSSRPVCPVVVRDTGGDCRPSAMSSSEWWASPCITASPSRSLSA